MGGEYRLAGIERQKGERKWEGTLLFKGGGGGRFVRFDLEIGTKTGA